MSSKQIDAIAHGIWVFVAGALAVFLSWGIGALTGHTVSLPIVLTPFIPLFVALAAYVLHVLQPDAPVQPTPLTPVTMPPAVTSPVQQGPTLIVPHDGTPVNATLIVPSPTPPPGPPNPKA